MNILIIGIGNLGFEVAKKINSRNNTLILVSRSLPDYALDFVDDTKKVFHIKGDATSVSDMLRVVKYIENVLSIKHFDSLIITPGIAYNDNFINDFDQFKKCFEYNYFAYINSLKVFLKYIPKKGNIVLISASSGHHADKRLSGYPASKWALESVFSSLRDELRERQISVDVVAVKTIKNKYSKIWLQKNGVNPTHVANYIVKLLKNPRNKRHFFPWYYSLLRFIERILPSVFDYYHGLNRKFLRKKKYSKQISNKVLITGAASGLGKALSEVYAETTTELFLLDINEQGLDELKSDIQAKHNCLIHCLPINITNYEKLYRIINNVESVDLLINNVGVRFQGTIEDTPIELFYNNLSVNFYPHLILISEFLKKSDPPKKIINVLSTTAIRGRSLHSLYSSAKAALWYCTRSLRRIYGNFFQIIEIIPSYMTDTKLLENSIIVHSQKNECKYSSSQKKRSSFQNIKVFFKVNNVSASGAARLIKKKEKKGKEIIYIPPLRAKLFMFLELLSSKLFLKIFRF